MPQDAFTLIYAAKELNDLIAGGKVNKITQPSRDEVFINLYTGKNVTLAVSANAQTARVCPTSRTLKSPTVAPNFCMLLRKHLTGATVKKVENVGFERITVLIFDAKNDFFEPVEKRLVCEIMGKYSNVILCENNKVLGSLRPPFGDISSGRILLPGTDYTLPPPQEKLEITDIERVKDAFSSFTSGDGARFTAETVKGISNQTAAEAVRRFTEKHSISSICGYGVEFADFLHGFLLNPEYSPNITDADKSDFYLFDYKTIEYKKNFFTSLIDAEKYYFDKVADAKEFKLHYKALNDKLRAQEKKLNKKKTLLEEKLLECSDSEINRIKGELLTAYQYAIPTGSAEAILSNYYSETGENIKIKLNPTVSVNQNAQAYFKKYQKQKKAIETSTPQLNTTLNELSYLSDLYEQLARCETTDDFDALKEEMRVAGYLHEQKRTDKKEKPSTPKTFEKDGFYIYAGRNNLQNDYLTAKAYKHDVWLHTKDFHSAHVIIETNGKTVPDEVLLYAAEICAYNSKAREGTKVPVDYCLKKYVKKPPKSKPGAAIYTNFKTILVTPNSHSN